MSGRRIRNWANRNLFLGSISSFDSAATENDPAAPNEGQSSQTYGSVAKRLEVVGEEHFGAEESEDAEGVHQKKRITALQAAWNVTNAIQGMFIVGLPFSVKVGGWTAILALVMVAYACYRTGIALISCLYDENGVKVRRSYRDVAEAVSPGLGKYVLTAQLTELASTCILYIVLAGDLLQGCIPSVDRPAWMMVITVLLLGTAFLDDIRIVSHLSLANAVSHLIINAIIVLYCLSRFSDWHISSVAIIPNFRLLPTIIGVVVFGYTSHIFLPSLEGSMKDPSEFKPMLSKSHIAAALFKSLFGLIGFLTFEELTQKEISNSLPNQGFKILVNLILVVKALLSYPLPYFAIVQLISENFFRGTNSMFTSLIEFIGNILVATAVTDFFVNGLYFCEFWMALSVPYLVELMGLIGNITGTVLSFIWPTYFHLKLKKDKLNEEEARFDKIMIVLGVLTCIVGVYYSSIELISAINYK